MKKAFIIPLAGLGIMACAQCTKAEAATSQLPVEFTTYDPDGNALSETHDPVADAKLRYWQDNYGNYIELTPF